MSRPWRDVTRAAPCSVCGRDSWCSRAEDGGAAVCRRMGDGGPARTDTTGAEYWVHWLNGSRGRSDYPEYVPAPEAPRAPVAKLDEVYRALLNELELSPLHREGLQERKLKDAEIERRGYRSLPPAGREKIAAGLVDRFGVEVCATIPGLYRPQAEQAGRWTVAGAAGLLIPARDVEGRIAGLRIRHDEAQSVSRYTWLSSKPRGGPSPGSPVHVALCSKPDGRVFLTEGELKADVAAALTGRLLLSVPGVGLWRPALPALRELEAQRIILAFDADARRKRCVGRALLQTAEALQAEGLEVELALWDESDGNGLDDLLAARKRPQFVKGAELVRQAAREIAEEAERRDPPVHLLAEATDPAPEAEPWSEPVPLRAAYSLPSFPTRALPAWLRKNVEALAEETQTPRDMAGLLSLVVLAAVCQGRYRVYVRDGWEEPLDLWGLVSLESGNRKSAVFKALFAPITEYDLKEAERLKVEVQQSAERLDVLKGKLNAAKAAVIKGSGDIADVDKLADEVAKFRPVRAPRLVAADVTPERAVGLLAENDGRLAVLSTEGGLFGTLAGRYSSHGGANLDAFLKAHAGEDIIVDRVGRPAEYVRSPALTLGLAVQPSVLDEAMSNPEFRGRGFMNRFMYALPESLLGRRNSRAPSVPPEIADAYRDGVARLLAEPPERDKQGEIVPCLLSLSGDALEALICFDEVQEPELGRGASLSPVKEWCSKLAGTVARVAALLHLAERGAAGGSIAVGEQAMAAAIEIAHWQRPHALAAFSAMEADPAVSSAEVILHWIERTGRREFSQRDALRGVSSDRFKKVADLEPALELLEAHCFIRRRKAPVPGPSGGRPESPVFDVNPLRQNRHNRQNPLNGGCGEGSVSSVSSVSPPESLRPEDEAARQEVKV